MIVSGGVLTVILVVLLILVFVGRMTWRDAVVCFIVAILLLWLVGAIGARH